MINIIDDDPSVLRAIARLMASADLAAETFSSAEEFLASADTEKCDCLVMDVHLGGMSGLQLQQKLSDMGLSVPIIFITAFDDDATRRKAKRGGAHAYFRKPFDDEALLDAIQFSVGHGRS